MFSMLGFQFLRVSCFQIVTSVDDKYKYFFELLFIPETAK